MDLGLTEEELDVRRRARALADAFEPFELQQELEGELPATVVDELLAQVPAAGLQAANMPAEWGGADLTVVEQVLAEEQLGRLTNNLWALVWRPANGLRYCSPAQRERFALPAIRGERGGVYAITEPGAGSDVRGIQTTAEATSDGWVINGEKWWASVKPRDDFMLLLAAVLPARQLTLFLIDLDTPGIRVAHQPPVMHTSVWRHPQFVLDDVHVTADAVLGEVGRGLEITMEWFVDERLMIAARCVGAATRALELAADFARTRSTFGRPLDDNQMIQAMLADSALDIALCRSFTYEVAWHADREADRKLLHAKAAIAKLASSEAAGRVVDRAVQIFGGRGYDAREPGRASLPRRPRRPDMGGHVGGPAHDHRE